MKPISIAIVEEEYELFRRAARRRGRPVAELIREAMAFYRAEKLERRDRLTDLPLLVGHRPRRRLPARRRGL
jgi:hypothetical protein